MADTMVDIYNDYVGGAPSSMVVERLQNIPVEDIPQVRYDADGEFYEGGNSDNTVAAVSAVAYANHDDSLFPLVFMLLCMKRPHQ